MYIINKRKINKVILTSTQNHYGKHKATKCTQYHINNIQYK